VELCTDINEFKITNWTVVINRADWEKCVKEMRVHIGL